MLRLVIDTDPGVDDAHAIMMALANPEVQVEALTTVAGNVSLDHTTANACKILDVMGKDVPVFAGAPRALVARNPYADDVHGQDGLGNCGWPASSRVVQSEHAALALIRMANENPGQLTLAAIGPLTNLALAVSLDPDLPGKYHKLVVMGGAIRGLGNTTPAAEFNTHADPEAAAIVFEAWRKFTLVSWETTVAHPFGPEQVDALLAVQSPRAEFFRSITANTLAFLKQITGQRILLGADFLAIAAAIEPQIIQEASEQFVEVELKGEKTYGQTVVDWYGRLGKEANAQLVEKMDSARLWELMQMALR